MRLRQVRVDKARLFARTGGRPIVWRLAFPAAAILAATILGTLQGAGADTTTSQTIAASADAYVSSSDATTNFGSASDLVLDAANDNSKSRIAHTYLRFEIPTSATPIAGATLRLYATNGDNSGFSVRPVSATWDE